MINAILQQDKHSDFNWILCPCRNGLHLTKKAVASFLTQDIEKIRVFLIMNEPYDGSLEWANSQPHIITAYQRPAVSVARSWNIGLRWMFNTMGAPYVLVCNNDVELHPETYKILSSGISSEFVTAVGNSDPECIRENKFPSFMHAEPRPHPDFSCFFIRKEVWDKVGEFDEKFLGAYCEDWDYHCRLKVAGIDAYCIDLPFYHHASGTLKNLSPNEQEIIQKQSARNREYFESKWGFEGGSPEYYNFLGTTNSFEMGNEEDKELN